MIMKLCVVKDMKAGLFLQLTSQRSVADAIRSWETVANDGESMITRFPNDFRLFYIADFNSETGVLTPLEFHQDLGSAADYVRSSAASPGLFDGLKGSPPAVAAQVSK